MCPPGLSVRCGGDQEAGGGQPQGARQACGVGRGLTGRPGSTGPGSGPPGFGLHLQGERLCRWRRIIPQPGRYGVWGGGGVWRRRRPGPEPLPSTEPGPWGPVTRAKQLSLQPHERAGLWLPVSFREHPGLYLPGVGWGGSRSGGGSAVGGGRARTWVTQGGARVEDPAGRAGRAQGSALTPPGHRGATTTRGPHFPPLLGCWQPCPYGGRCDCREGSRKSLGDSRHLFPIVPGAPITCGTLSRLRKD